MRLKCKAKFVKHKYAKKILIKFVFSHHYVLRKPHIIIEPLDRNITN